MLDDILGAAAQCVFRLFFSTTRVLRDAQSIFTAAHSIVFNKHNMLITVFPVLSVLPLLSVSFAGPSPPPGALIVGQGGEYSTIQKAIDAAGSGKIIFIRPGI